MEKELRKALEEIKDIPFSMVNDSESLRRTLRQMQTIARQALLKVGGGWDGS